MRRGPARDRPPSLGFEPEAPQQLQPQLAHHALVRAHPDKGPMIFGYQAPLSEPAFDEVLTRRSPRHVGGVVDAHPLTVRQGQGARNLEGGLRRVERGYDTAAGARLPGVNVGTACQRAAERGSDS